MRICTRRSMLAGVAVLLGVLTVGPAPAGAKSGYVNLCPSLKTVLCTGIGGALYDYGVAVDNSSGPSAGDVWFASESGTEVEHNLRLLKFDASGNLLAEVNNSNIPEPAEPFANTIFGVAVDPANGDVYASDFSRYERSNHGAENGAVTKFDSAGVFQLQITGSETPQGSFFPFSVTVDPLTSDLYVADAAHKMIDVFTSSGAYIEQFPAPVEIYYNSLAAGPEGNIYMGREGEVKEYSPTGTPITCPGGKDSLPAGNVDAAVDPSNGHIFVAESSFIAEYSSLCATVPSRELGNEEAVFNANAGETAIGVSGSTHQIYISYSNNDFTNTFGLFTVPTVTTGAPATNVTLTSATVSGTVNPEGAEVTTCEFEYGPTAAYGSTRPCSPAPPFNGGLVAVGAEIAFPSLHPGDAIHYRLKTGGPLFGREVGEDETYVRAAPPTVVGTLPASSVTQFAATLNGTIETGEEVADYHFEYGTTTAYGQIAPIPDNYTPISIEPIPISQPILGLQAGTTYHYRLIASSPGGTEVKGPDETFTTLPVPAPTITTGGVEGVGVGSATLTGTIDPYGWDTTYLFQYGTSTAYGQSWPTVQVDMGALEGAQPVVVNVPELLPGTTYHYRLVATNGGGTSYGSDMTFTTGEYSAQVIQEPVALRTLLVPSGGEVAKLSSKHGKKAKKHKKHTKRKSKTRKKKKR